MGKRFLAVITIACVAAACMAVFAGCGTRARASLTSVVPSSGEHGAEVTLDGSGFGSGQGASSVEFGNVTADIVSWSDSEIVSIVPPAIEPGEYAVVVFTDAGSSNSLSFEVTGKKGEAHDDRRQGQIEHNTPVQAILEYCGRNGIDATGMTFSVVIVSGSNPEWKIDQGYRASTGAEMFLLHKVSEEWTVVGHAPEFTAGDLARLGAPADLLPPSQPDPHPNTQARAITSYLEENQMPADGWQLVVAKISRDNPSWEIVKGTRGGRADNFLLVWNSMLGDWEVLADGGPPWPGVEFKGEQVPADLDSL